MVRPIRTDGGRPASVVALCVVLVTTMAISRPGGGAASPHQEENWVGDSDDSATNTDPRDDHPDADRHAVARDEHQEISPPPTTTPTSASAPGTTRPSTPTPGQPGFGPLVALVALLAAALLARRT